MKHLQRIECECEQTEDSRKVLTETDQPVCLAHRMMRVLVMPFAHSDACVQ